MLWIGPGMREELRRAVQDCGGMKAAAPIVGVGAETLSRAIDGHRVLPSTFKRLAQFIEDVSKARRSG